MSKEKQIEFERNEIAQIIADNFKLNDEKYDASDFEWSAYCVQIAGYRKERQGEWVEKDNPNYRTVVSKDIFGNETYLIRNYCSVCNHKSKDIGNYCPNCGAKMKGAE